MGLFDRMKKKFEAPDSEKKISNVVDASKKNKKQKTKSKKDDDKGLTKEEIRQAQSMETGKSGKAPDKTADAKKSKAKKEPRDTKKAYRTLMRPIVSEKASYMGSQNAYMFEVWPDTTKNEVAKAVQSVYGVEPSAVRIIKVKGKAITFGRTKGRTRNWKKAIVTLPKGKTIDIYQS